MQESERIALSASTYSRINGVTVSLSRKKDRQWRVNVGGRCVFKHADRSRVRDVFMAVRRLLRHVLAGEPL